MYIFIIFLLFLIILYILNNITDTHISHTNNMIDTNIIDTNNMIDNNTIVIARYNEDLEWLHDEKFTKYNIIIYNKGINDNFIKLPNMTIINLENVGRDSHTYLYYIINNYNNLSNITIFLPGSCNMKFKNIKMIKLLNLVEKNNKAVFMYDYKFNNLKNQIYDFKLDNWTSTCIENKNINPESKLELSEIRPFGKWFDYYFGNIVIKHLSYNCIFSIAKEDILQHPIEYYQNLIIQLNNTSNSEAIHYFERSWEAVFYPMNNSLFYPIKYNTTIIRKFI